MSAGAAGEASPREERAGGSRERLAEALAALHERVPLGMRLGLDPMRAACARAGHPERAFEIVHVAGTNGKGSTCAMVDAMARAAGRRTGLYTSPHLVRFAERIRVDGEPIGDSALAAALEEALEVGGDLSFFEVATFAALLAFREAAVELAVLEVGLGGRLDATNVVTPRVTAITGIALDHQDMLGVTLDAIAREKAAIAKPGVPMVLGALPEEARAAAVAVAIANGARLVDALPLPADARVGLLGPHQRDNARVAWTVGAELGLADDARARGLMDARWPGRLERVEVRGADLAGPWLLDGAHNPDGARALVRAVEGEDVGAVVFGALEDKAWREMLGVVAAGIDAPRVYVAPAGRAAADLAELRGIADGSVASAVAEALRAARRTAGARSVVVCGSLYLVGEARAGLLGLMRDPTVAL